MIKGRTENINHVTISGGNRFEVTKSENNTTKNFMIETRDNIFLQVIFSKSENKVFLSTGFGISILNIEDKTIQHQLFFDRDFEKLYKEDYYYEDNLLPKIA